MTYPHDTLIRAWLDGKTLQFLDNGVWVDCEHVSTAAKVPHCYRNGTQYRIKPRLLRYRVYLLPSTGQCKVATTLQDADVADKLGAQWVGEWCEVVVQ